jgi:hypothetical protein
MVAPSFPQAGGRLGRVLLTPSALLVLPAGAAEVPQPMGMQGCWLLGVGLCEKDVEQ